MKRINNILYITLSVAFIFLCVIQTFAHPGGTDASGGHYDFTTGEYHYHHGYPAHQHTDGICPYNFDDNVERNRSANSSGNSSNYYKKRYSLSKTNKRNVRTDKAFEPMHIDEYSSYRNRKEKSHTIYYICGFFSICSILCLISLFWESRDNYGL